MTHEEANALLPRGGHAKTTKLFILRRLAQGAGPVHGLALASLVRRGLVTDLGGGIGALTDLGREALRAYYAPMGAP